MEESLKEEIKNKIEEELLKTQKSIIEYKEITKPIAPENAIGRISRMDAINNKSVNDAALRNAKEKLKKLEYVQSQLDADDFGICAKCRKQIPLGRILLVPQSRFCVGCAS
jgi:DnaK suppressor protein